jgi:hypothetical protein
VPFLVLILLSLFIAPWLGLFVLAFFLVFLLVLVPLGFAARSFLWLFMGPRQLLAILFNRRVRRNHALEHATAHVLEGRFGPLGQVSGYAVEQGFYLSGNVSPEEMFNAATEALQRLAGGERELAVHGKCGTTLIVTNLLSSLVFILLLVVSGRLGWLNLFLALLVANFLGAGASRFVQRFVTTDADVAGMEILGVEAVSATRNFGGLRFYAGNQTLVRTRQPGGNARIAEVVS